MLGPSSFSLFYTPPRTFSSYDLNEKAQCLTPEQASIMSREHSRSLLGLTPSSRQLKIDENLGLSSEALYMIEACLCSQDLNFEEIEEDSHGRTLLHRFVLNFDEPTGRYHQKKEKLKLVGINQSDESDINQLTDGSIHKVSRIFLISLAEHYKYLIKKDIYTYSNKLDFYVDYLIDNFYNLIQDYISNSNPIKFDQYNTFYNGAIDSPKTELEQITAEISKYLTNRCLTADLYLFARELTIIDKIVFALATRGVDLNATMAKTEKTALHLAVQKEGCFLLVLALLKYGANPDCSTEDLDSPLHLAVQSEEALSTVPILLEYNANANLTNRNVKTPLHFAVKSKYAASLVPLLLKYDADPDIYDENLNTPLHYAVQSEDAVSIVPMLLEYGAEINFHNEDLDAPLHLAVQSKHAVSVVPILLDVCDADPDVPNKFGERALHLAIKSEDALSLVPILLEYGSNPDLSNDDLDTAMHLAVQSKDALSLVPILFKHKANLSLLNKEGKTALDIARSKGDYRLIRLLERLIKLTIPPEKMRLGVTAATQKIDKNFAIQEKISPSKLVRSMTGSPQEILKKYAISKETVPFLGTGLGKHIVEPISFA